MIKKLMETTTHYTIKQMSPQLLVADIDRSVEFYTKKLSFEVAFRYEDFYAGIIKDNCSIHLKVNKPPLERRKDTNDDQDLSIVFSVDSIENLYEELSNKSVEFAQALRDMPY